MRILVYVPVPNSSYGTARLVTIESKIDRSRASRRLCRWNELPLTGKQTGFCSNQCGKAFHNSRFMRPQDRKIQRELACLDALPVPQRRVELMKAAYKFGLLK